MADVEDPDHDDEQLVESMGKLQGIQGELDKINKEEIGKVMEVKHKYNEFRKALYNRRNKIIQSMSGFWITAFLGHPALADRVCEEDEKVFKYMVSLEVEDFNYEESGYSITFNFLPNPFFEGTKLTKTFSFSEDETTNVISTAIKWKDGMNIASGSAWENKGAKRPLAEDSFFSWFGKEQETLPVDVIDEKDEEDVNEAGSDDDDDDHNDEAGSDDDDDHHNDEDKNDEDFSGSGRNDADNDHNDEEYDDEDFNLSDSDDDEIEVIDDNENIEEDEIQDQYGVEPDDDEEEIEEQSEDEDDD